MDRFDITIEKSDGSVIKDDKVDAYDTLVSAFVYKKGRKVTIIPLIAINKIETVEVEN